MFYIILTLAVLFGFFAFTKNAFSNVFFNTLIAIAEKLDNFNNKPTTTKRKGGF